MITNRMRPSSMVWPPRTQQTTPRPGTRDGIPLFEKKRMKQLQKPSQECTLFAPCLYWQPATGFVPLLSSSQFRSCHPERLFLARRILRFLLRTKLPLGNRKTNAVEFKAVFPTQASKGVYTSVVGERPSWGVAPPELGFFLHS